MSQTASLHWKSLLPSLRIHLFFYRNVQMMSKLFLTYFGIVPACIHYYGAISLRSKHNREGYKEEWGWGEG